MNWYEIALGVVLIAVSLLIIVFTLAQEQKGQSLPKAWSSFAKEAGILLPREKCVQFGDRYGCRP